MKKLNKKGFTLIELLAVIIILGVLMIIAIPAVTKYINDSRRSSYVDSAISYVDAVMKEAVAANDMKMISQNTLYMVAVGQDKAFSCVPLESGGKSPYSDTWKYAFVGVTISNEGNHYYFVSEDGNGTGLAFINNKDLEKNGTDKLYTDHGNGENQVSDSYATTLKTAYESTSAVAISGEQLVAPYTSLTDFVNTTEGKTISNIVFITQKGNSCKY